MISSGCGGGKAVPVTETVQDETVSSQSPETAEPAITEASTDPGTPEDTIDTTNAAISAGTDDTSGPEDTENTADTADSGDNADETAEEENVWDGGPYFDSIADELYSLTDDMTIEEAAEHYAVTLKGGGRYAGFEGDIGDVIPEYKGVDLDGDHKSDVIRREGQHYVFEFSRGDSFKTGDYPASPNEGQIIEFQDTACRNADEIMIAHYTFGTGGPSVGSASIYSNVSGEWKAYPLIARDGRINSRELRDHIAERTGQPYTADSVRVAGVEMTTLLLDYGTKDGPDQTTDYEAVYLHKSFMPEYIDDRDDYVYYGYNYMWTMINNWPLEMSGNPVTLSPDLQYRMNIFLSNFSEQRYAENGLGWSPAHFVLQWCRINSPSRLVHEDGRLKIDQSELNNVLIRYFNANLEESEFYGSGYDNPYGGRIEYDGEKGWYSEPDAGGEMYANNAFTVVTEVQDISYPKEPAFRVSYKIYRLDTDEYDAHGIGKEQYSLTPNEAEALVSDGKLYLHTEGTAIIADAGEDGFKLLYYKVYDQ